MRHLARLAPATLAAIGLTGADGSGLANLTNHSGMDRGPSWLPARRSP